MITYWWYGREHTAKLPHTCQVCKKWIIMVPICGRGVVKIKWGHRYNAMNTVPGWGQLLTTVQFSSVQFNHSVVSNSLRPRGKQHNRPPSPSPTPRVYPNSRPLSQWCHPAISSSVVPFSSHLQSFPASASFPMSQFFPSGGHSIGVSASISVFPMDIQDWFPLWLTGWISLLSKGLLRVFNTTIQKHQFFIT